MTKHIFPIFWALLCLALIVSCSDSVTDSDPDPSDPPASEEEEEKQLISIAVDWQNLDQIQDSDLMSLDDNEITHFGVRLVYEDENAVYMQAVEKESAEEEGLITLEVPPTDNAQFYAVAVKDDGGMSSYLQLAGAMYDISILQGEPQEWGVDDFEWIEPYWEVIEEKQDDFESGQFAADKDDEHLLIIVYARHPFQHELFGLNGSSQGCEREERDGYYSVCVRVDNPTPGTENTSEHSFWPFLNYSYFNLPEGRRYIVEKQGTVEVHWNDTGQNDDEPDEQPSGNVILSIDWDQLDTPSSLLSQLHSQNSVTHFGLRLIHPDEDEAFVESLERTPGDDAGFIAMDIPEGENLQLFAVAVDEGPEPYVNLMGTLRNQSLSGDTIEVTLDDFEWVEPEWSIVDSLQTEFESEAMTADKDEERISIPYHVTNPYDTDIDIQYPDRHIKHSGSSGSTLEIENGMHTIPMYANNPEEGEEATVDYTQWPYLDAEMFDLPDHGYVVGKEKMEFTVKWE